MKKLTIWMGLCFFLLSTTPLSADIIYLKNGNKVRGKVIEKKGDWLRVKVPRGVIYLKKSNVDRIEKEKEEDYALGQARHLRGLSALEDSLHLLEKALKKNPTSQKVRRELKKTYLKCIRKNRKEKRLAQSQKYIAQALEYFPQDRDILAEKEKNRAYYSTVERLKSQGQSLLAQGRYERAIEILEKVGQSLPESLSEIAPSLGKAHTQLGHKKYRGKKYSQARKHFRKALKFVPKRAQNLETYMVMATLKECNQFFRRDDNDRAEKLLKKMLEFSPGHPRLVFFLGATYHRQNQLDKAARYYAQVLHRTLGSSYDITELQKEAARAARIHLGSNPSRQKYQKVLPGSWRKITTAHFVIYHRNHDIGRRAACLSEAQFKKILQAFPSLSTTGWTKKCHIYIYPTRSQYLAQLSKHSKWTAAGVTMVRFSAGRLHSHRILTYQKAPNLFKSVLPHEVGHAVLYLAVKYRRMPRWYQEGVAVAQEFDYHRNYYQWRVRSALLRGEFYGLKALLSQRNYPRQGGKKRDFYAHSYSLVDFLLHRGGWKKVIQFGNQLATSKKPEVALREVFGFASLQRAEKEWKIYAARQGRK